MEPAFYRSLRKHPYPFRLFIALCLRRLGISSWFFVKRKDCFLRFYPVALATAAFANPDFGKEDDDFLHRYLRPGDVVLDVGANIGTLSLTASACVGLTGKVLAFEAHPRTFEMLVENIDLNKRVNIFPHNLALAQREGRLLFSDFAADDQNLVLEGGPGIEVPAGRLDSFIGAEAKVSLLKIDVEGYEKFVLLGGIKGLEKVDCVYFESFEKNSRRFGYPCSEVLSLLAQAGFALYRLEANVVIPIGADYASLDCENLIAVRDAASFLERTGYRLL